MTNPTDALMQFVNTKPDNTQPVADANISVPESANIDNGTKDKKVIISSKKISNAALREFVYMYRFGKKFSDHDILELIMGLDELIESDKLSNEMLDEAKKDPNILKNN